MSGKLNSYLGDVDLGPFSSRYHHGLEVVVFRQGLLCRGARFVSSIIENAIHLILKCLTQRVSWGGFQLIVMGLLNDLETVFIDT